MQWIIMQSLKKEFFIRDNMDGPRVYYAKWNKSNTERQILCGVPYIWNRK